jgi:hypothetical protein
MGEPSFTETPESTLESVAGAVVHGEVTATGGLFLRDTDTVTCPFVTGVGQGGQVGVGTRPGSTPR